MVLEDFILDLIYVIMIMMCLDEILNIIILIKINKRLEILEIESDIKDLYKQSRSYNVLRILQVIVLIIAISMVFIILKPYSKLVWFSNGELIIL